MIEEILTQKHCVNAYHKWKVESDPRKTHVMPNQTLLKTKESYKGKGALYRSEIESF